MQKPEKAARVAVILLALCLMYVLSIGPASGIIVWTGISPSGPVGSCVRVFYWPIECLHDHALLKGPFVRYVAWWERLGQRLR